MPSAWAFASPQAAVGQTVYVPRQGGASPMATPPSRRASSASSETDEARGLEAGQVAGWVHGLWVQCALIAGWAAMVQIHRDTPVRRRLPGSSRAWGASCAHRAAAGAAADDQLFAQAYQP